MNIIDKIYSIRQEFILIGLTGRIGSGCTETANFFSKKLNDLPYHFDENKDRGVKIVENFIKNSWNPFLCIKVSDIITYFILKHSAKRIKQYLKDNELCKEHQGLKNIKLEPAWYKNAKNYYRTIEKLDDDSQDIINALKGLTDVTKTLKEKLSNIDNNLFTKVYQQFGDNIRKTGKAINGQDIKNGADTIYTIVKKIEDIIQVIKKHNDKDKKYTWVVIDALRSPFEILYFKERYSSYYTFSINCDKYDRNNRLIEQKNYNKSEIDTIDTKEGSTDKKTYENIDDFVSQNIPICIELSDIHIDNSGKYKDKVRDNLIKQLFRYVSLILHPGLIPPSKDEYLMQIAYNAKENSQCISRKVGAIIVNNTGNICGVGWNNVPEGQIGCLLRNADLLKSCQDQDAFSEFERNNDEFRGNFNRFFQNDLKDLPKHLNKAFCTKDVINYEKENKNQVYTRALHAEENAFLQSLKNNGESVEGGTLYVTSSPCELCSKKAYQLKIKKIVYLDPYPGNAIDLILNTGPEFNRPEIVLFQGAIGNAFLKLYSSFLPYKDELKSIVNNNSI